MEILIPTLLRIKPKAFNRVGKYLRSAGWATVGIVWGEGIETMFGERLRISLDATDIRIGWQAVAADNRIENLFAASLDIPQAVKALVAVGGGKAIDCAKYLAHLKQLPLVVVPTAISNDGFCSPFSSLLVKEARRTVRTVLPEGVVLDTEILAASPPAMLYSGMGDLFCKYTAVFDWKLAYHQRGEPVNDFAAVMARNAADTFLHFAPKRLDDLEFLRVLASSLMMSGIAMEIAGSSRPASGAEHLVSHAYDQVAAKPSLHGIQVGVASFALAHLQETTREAVARAAEDSGFLAWVEAHPLSRRDFVEAVKRAPGVKEDFHTVLSGPGAVEQLLDFIAGNAQMGRLLAEP